MHLMMPGVWNGPSLNSELSEKSVFCLFILQLNCTPYSISFRGEKISFCGPCTMSLMTFVILLRTIFIVLFIVFPHSTNQIIIFLKCVGCVFSISNTVYYCSIYSCFVIVFYFSLGFSNFVECLFSF